VPCLLTLILALSFAASVRADPAVELSGTVTDRVSGEPVSGVLVHAVGAGNQVKETTTDAAGGYHLSLPPGPYKIVFAFARAQQLSSIDLTEAKTLDAKIDSASGETIVIHDPVKPKRLPKAKNYAPSKAPPYSDKAVTADAWTRAWMLLDIDENGTVVRFKWLKRPGYDLEKIAEGEVWKIKFDPALGPDGKPMRVQALWKFEWPSVGWIQLMTESTRSYSPSGVTAIQGDKASDFRAHSPFAYVPCAGESSANLDSYYPTTRDCSQPDLAQADREPWIVRGVPHAEPAQASVTFAAPPAPPRSKVPALAATSATLALAVTSVLVNHHRKSLAETLGPDENAGPCEGDCAVARDAAHAAREREIERYRKYTIGLGVATVAVGAATAFLWTRAFESRNPRSPSLSLDLAPSGASVGLSLGF